MKRFKQYFENRNTMVCQECGTKFTMRFWNWLLAMHIIDEWRYTKCPQCKKWHWNKRIHPNLKQVDCHKCSYENDCETRDMRDGCCLGNKNNE